MKAASCRTWNWRKSPVQRVVEHGREELNR
jgi:hypothetical protein